MHKYFIAIFLTIFLIQPSFSKEIPLKVAPIKEITTCKDEFKKGDIVEFQVKEDVYSNGKKIIEKGTKVEGIITEQEDNGFMIEPASIYAENFTTTDINGKRLKLNGIIYEKGTDYWMLMQFFQIFSWTIRGGEVHIKPKKTYILYLTE